MSAENSFLEIMEYFWTSKNPIKGLRHFVLLNVMEEKGKTFFF